MTAPREVEILPFDADLARARVLHVAEGILVCLNGCTPEEALAAMVAVARRAGQSTFTVAEELMRIAVGATSSTVVEQYWRERTGQRSP
jgi:ANTAR domain